MDPVKNNVLKGIDPSIKDEINKFNAVWGKKKITYENEENYIDSGEFMGYVSRKLGVDIENNYQFVGHFLKAVTQRDLVKFITDNFNKPYKAPAIAYINNYSKDPNEKMIVGDIDVIFHELARKFKEFTPTPVSKDFEHIPMKIFFGKIVKERAPAFTPPLTPKPVASKKPAPVKAPVASKKPAPVKDEPKPKVAPPEPVASEKPVVAPPKVATPEPVASEKPVPAAAPVEATTKKPTTLLTTVSFGYSGTRQEFLDLIRNTMPKHSTKTDPELIAYIKEKVVVVENDLKDAKIEFLKFLNDPSAVKYGRVHILLP